MFQVLKVILPSILRSSSPLTCKTGFRGFPPQRGPSGWTHLPGSLFPDELVSAQLQPDTAVWEKGWKIRLCSASSHSKVYKSSCRFKFLSPFRCVPSFLLFFKFREARRRFVRSAGCRWCARCAPEPPGSRSGGRVQPRRLGSPVFQ